MRIILLENENITGNNTGGINSYIKNILEYLNNEGIKNYFAGVINTESKAGNLFPGTSLIRILPKKKSNFIFYIKLFFSLGKLPNQMDVVYHLNHPYMIIPFLLRKKKALFVLTLHGLQEKSYFYHHNRIQYYLYLIIFRISINKYDKIIASNETIADYYKKKYLLDENKIKVIPSPVNLNIFYPGNKALLREQFGFENSAKIIIYAGRISSEKNLDLLVDSYKILMDKINDLQLLIIGEGPEKNHLSGRIIKENLNKIKLFDFTDQKTIAGLLNCSDVFALTSLFEGSPTAIKEALACNLPVVTTNAGDVKKVLEDIEGCFISESEPDKFAACLFKVLGSETGYDYKSKIEIYGTGNIIPEIMNTYRDLLKKQTN